jgi:hypothetical protein
MITRRLLLVSCLTMGIHARAVAQDQAPGGRDFDNHGEVTVGYRFTDVKGYAPQYQQMFNLRDGFRLQDFTLRGTPRNAANPFADDYFISATGLGGDPYETAQLKVAKTGLYDFRVQWRQSYYYWNQNDNVVLPITSVAPALSKGLTDNHDWSSVRKLGTADLTLYATNNLRFNFDFARTTTSGTLLTTRSLDFFNSPMFWGTFARANPYPLNAPLDDETNRVAAGVDYTWRDWHFHYNAGFQSFDENVALNPVALGEVSINPAVSSQSQPLTQLSWSQSRSLKTPLSEFYFRGKLHSNVEWRGGYVYTRYRGPSTEDLSFSGIAPTSSTGPLGPYTVSEGGRANVSEPGHNVNQGLTWRLRSWLDVNVDYRYTRYTSETNADLQSVYNGSLSTGTDEIIWKSGLSDLEFSMLFSPLDNLVLRPGVRFSKVDIESLENGVVDSARTLRTKHARPEFRFGYKPFPKISFRGDIHGSTSSSSYTAITPYTTVAGKLITRYEPLPNLSVENALTISTARLVDSAYRNNVRAASLTVSYAIGERFSAFASATYDSFFAEGDIVYARGTSPLTSLIRDQEIHRVWQAGMDLKATRYFGVRASGSYDRLTGNGEIVGEPPAYGPLKWPLATATLYFDVPRAGRLWIDLQRSYYIEELVPVNNFSANLLMLRFTRPF